MKDLIDRLATAAANTDGFFTFRNGKLFGKLIIIVNKCQDISKAVLIKFFLDLECMIKNIF